MDLIEFILLTILGRRVLQQRAEDLLRDCDRPPRGQASMARQVCAPGHQQGQVHLPAGLS